jgi:hypothetical protein
LLRDQGLRKREPGFTRYPPDAGLAEAEIAAFDGFWQPKPSTRGSRAPKPVTLAPSAENVDFVVIQTHLWFLIGRKTIKRFTSIRLPADGDLSHLECDVAAMADDVDGLSSTAS